MQTNCRDATVTVLVSPSLKASNSSGKNWPNMDQAPPWMMLAQNVQAKTTQAQPPSGAWTCVCELVDVVLPIIHEVFVFQADVLSQFTDYKYISKKIL